MPAECLNRPTLSERKLVHAAAAGAHWSELADYVATTSQCLQLY